MRGCDKAVHDNLAINRASGVEANFARRLWLARPTVNYTDALEDRLSFTLAHPTYGNQTSGAFDQFENVSTHSEERLLWISCMTLRL